MFLTDRLKAVLNDRTIEPMEMAYALLNECVAYIRENTNAGMPIKDCVAIIKRTDNCWRLFCKENDLQSADLFKQAYIDERMKKLPAFKNYFK